MALKGRAFLAIWHDIAPEGEDDYNAWHTRQHMPERMGVPGFLLGRRCVNRTLDRQQWFTLYEAETLETFSSDGYRARLNSPTQWSGRVQPHFRNFARSACTLSASTGRGIGGAMATVRLDMDPAALVEFEVAATVLAHRLMALPGIVGAHLGVAAPSTTRIQTRESELRAATGEEVFDAVVLLDTTGPGETAAAMPSVQAILEETLPFRSMQAATYDLAYLLAAADAM